MGVGAASAQSASHTLRTAFSFDQGSLDPDVFYDAEGLTITLAVYEGLVQYSSNDTTAIVPSLASSWTESANGLTYTFHLRPNVLFHDGTQMTSSTWKYDFERRTGVNGGPAYMVSAVSSMSTPNPLTFVVNLKHPVSAFLNYMASPYGPKAISPTAISKHKTTKDPWATDWLANHDAGTGPYELSSVVPGQSYVLKSFPKYWGSKPYYTTVDISQIPDFTTQELDLQQGTLDVMLHGVLPSDLKQLFKNNPKFTVHEFPSIVRLNLWINPHLAPFNDKAVRLAVAQDLNRQAIIRDVFGDTATVATQMFTAGALPANDGTFDPKYDPSALKNAVKGVTDKKVVLAYTTDDPTNEAVAELIAQDLDAAGLQVTTKGVTEAVTFNWPTKPVGRANMLILPANPDDADASAWASLFYENGGGLSYFEPGVTAADKLLNAGLGAVSKQTILSDYTQAANLYRESGDFIPLADEKEVAVSQSNITGFSNNFGTLWTVRLWDLKAK
jgi:peptide/nickel transport system substrate-binding protein